MSNHPLPVTCTNDGDALVNKKTARSAGRSRRRLVIGLISALIIALLFSGSTPASASVDPVGYATGATGPMHCYTSTFSNGSGYAYLDVAPPSRVLDYTGTYNIRWIAQVFEWENGSWVLTVQSGAYAQGAVYTAGWYQIGYWVGPLGRGNLELSAVRGHYFTAVETTAWYDSAGRMITSYVNGTNVVAC